MKTQISIDHWGGKRLIRLLPLILALALAAPVLLAQESDRLTGRDKHDPTGAWLLRTPITDPAGNPLFALAVFNRDGTFTQTIQAESAFDPGAVSDPNSFLNILTSPQGGVWQKTPSRGSNTFAATFLAIEYHNIVPAPPALPRTPLFRFDNTQYTGRLSQDGDAMEITAVSTFFDAQGNQIDPKDLPPITITGVRIPLVILPSIAHSLPTPPPLPK